MTPDEIAEGQEIIEAATPGPWTSISVNHEKDNGAHRWFLAINGEECTFADGNKEFILAAREGWPKALDEVERLRKENKIYVNRLFEQGKQMYDAQRLIDKLRAVAEAAEDASSRTPLPPELLEALKAWKED